MISKMYVQKKTPKKCSIIKSLYKSQPRNKRNVFPVRLTLIIVLLRVTSADPTLYSACQSITVA